MPQAQLTQHRLQRTTHRISTSEAIRTDLRSKIIRLELKPGELISENDLCASYGVSRTPVREALRRLAMEKLVDVVPQSGTYISPIPVSALEEAIVIRNALEKVTAQEAANRATKHQIDDLWAIIEQQKRMLDREDPVGFHASDEDLHARIAAISGYAGIWDLVLQVKAQIDRYRHLLLPDIKRWSDVIAEHSEIVEGIARHDPAQAAEAMQKHLGHLKFDLHKVQRQYATYFLDDREHA